MQQFMNETSHHDGSGYAEERTEISVYPLNPIWLIVISIVAGTAAAGPVAGAILYRCGKHITGWVTGILSGMLGLVILALLFVWKVEWYWVTLTFLSINILCGTGLFFLLRDRHKAFIISHPHVPEEPGTYREVIAGMTGGVFIGGLLGTCCTLFYLLFSDWLFSTLMPVTFEDEFALFRLFSNVFFLVASGAFAGGCVGRFKKSVTPGRMIGYGFFMIWAYFTWVMALECVIAIPGFQAGAATGSGWKAIIAPFMMFNILIGFWWAGLLMFYIARARGVFRKVMAGLQVAAINMIAAITLSISFGYPADIFLATGMHFERSADTAKALWCYEHGLGKDPSGTIASYLQYRVALLYHKLGKPDQAKNGFRRVVAKYTSNMELVKKSNRFLDSMERSGDKKRVVLPGVETPTEYKGSYCVPNSLALAMRYWGADISPGFIGSKITGLGSGTFIVNQQWFAEQEGFRHEFLPMAGIGDIKRCIDAGFPVLVYVPSHVFAIVGYDEVLETFVTYDVATQDVWEEYIQKDFIKAWKREATTLVLVFPPGKEALIPEDIRTRMAVMSDNYLHFQLHYFDSPGSAVSVHHLLKAAGDTGEFFFPVTILYSDFPGLRDTLSRKYDADFVAHSIQSFFSDDFDEGIHLWGQYHNENLSRQDWAFKYSVQFLIAHKQFDLVNKLIAGIDEEGQLSGRMLANAGMIDLARGKFEEGLDRLMQSGDAGKLFYTGLADLRIGDRQGAIRELVKTVSGVGCDSSESWGDHDMDEPDDFRYQNTNFYDRISRMRRLDEYGYPVLPIANHILVNTDDYGKSRECLEAAWESWVQQNPFDVSVADALVKLYGQRLAKLGKIKDAAVYQRLERKLKLAESRAARYNPSVFLKNSD